MALVHSPDLTNGPNGLNLPRLTLGGISVSSAREVYYFLLPVALAAILLTRNIVRSKVGRGLTAMRDSDVAASCCGLSLMRNKVLAFTLSAFYAGIAGGLYAMTVRFIEPGDFGLVQSIAQLTMLVVGGLGTMTGAILGSIIMTLLPEALRGLNVLSELAYGVLLIGFVVFMPNGIQQIFRRARS
jgi:branched-chain amino acid transport system permease protein